MIKAAEIATSRTAIRNTAAEEVLKILDTEVRKHFVQKYVPLPLAVTVAYKSEDTVKRVGEVLKEDGWEVLVALAPDGQHVYVLYTKK